MKIRIKQPYSPKMVRFESYPKFITLPYLNCVFKNLETGEEDIISNRFRVDSGADISLINGKYEDFVNKMTPLDYLPIQYGGSPNPKRLPVYKIGLIINGYEIEVTAAYDRDAPFLLLGHYQFFEYNNTLFDSSLKQLKIYRK